VARGGTHRKSFLTPEQQNFLWESALLAVIFRFNFKLVEDELGTRL
jgi:hypothetical protein